MLYLAIDSMKVWNVSSWKSTVLNDIGIHLCTYVDAVGSKVHTGTIIPKKKSPSLPDIKRFLPWKPSLWWTNVLIHILSLPPQSRVAIVDWQRFPGDEGWSLGQGGSSAAVGLNRTVGWFQSLYFGDDFLRRKLYEYWQMQGIKH